VSLNKNLGLLLLGIWLIVSGLLSLIGVGGAVIGIIVAVLAIAAGVVILIVWRSWSARIGMLLLAIWLIVSALLSLLGFSFPGIGLILAVLAIAVGVVILIEGRRGLRSSIGMILLCVWLILMGLLALLSVGFTGSGTILAVLAIVAGVLILLKR
jgi:hypothetical protein